MTTIITASEGEGYKAVRAITWPRLALYAEMHGMDFRAYEMPDVVERPSSWKKLVSICKGLADSESVLWVDADVFVLNFRADITSGIPDGAWQAMVRHSSPEGDLPNAGVWFLRRPMLPLLMLAAMSDWCISHKWWEQAAIHRMLGFEENQAGVVVHTTETTLYRHTHWLPESWNVCMHSPEGIEQNWLHACGVPDRLRQIEEWNHAATS